MSGKSLPGDGKRVEIPTGEELILLGDPDRGAGTVLATGPTVPADASTGYAPGCLFIHIDGGAGTALYVNEGTKASSDFDAVTVA